MAAWDDMTGKSVEAAKVAEASRLEVEYYKKMEVLAKVARQVCFDFTGKAPLQARWIDSDKGTRYRSRWVAKQFKGVDEDKWFAATPPL